MIEDVLTSKGSPAITSDRWHVVRSHFTDAGEMKPYLREVVSEHPTRLDCRKAALTLRALLDDQVRLTLHPRDEVFVLPPRYKSLKRSRQRKSAQRTGSRRKAT